MDTTYFKGLTRKEYIEKAYEIIEKEGVEDISIRQIAKELGCSSAALYRYFDSKSELLYYINLQKLGGYINRLNQAKKKWKNIWEMYVGVWDCYCREAFRYPKAFNMLFFKNTNETLSGAIKEYYQMFPEYLEDTNEIFYQMLNTPDFLARDFEVCKRCVQEKAITYENAVKLNRIVCMLYKGYFKTAYDNNPEEDEIDRLTKEFIEDIDVIVKNLAKDLKGYKGYYYE